MSLNVKLDPASEARLKSLCARFPQFVRRAAGRSASIARARLRRVMRTGGGTDGVPVFAAYDPTTVAWHFGGKVKKSNRLGGTLSSSSSIVMFRRGEEQIIGWPDYLAPWASAFQNSERYTLTKSQRRLFHTCGRQDVPAEYNRAARPVIAPFVESVRREYRAWFLGNMEKLAAGEIGK